MKDKPISNIDREVIKNMKRLDTNMQSEREAAFFFYFPDEYLAHHAATALTNLQFETEVSYSEHGTEWLCLASKPMIVTTERLIGLRNWMETLAEKYDGNYDGWETTILPEGD